MIRGENGLDMVSNSGGRAEGAVSHQEAFDGDVLLDVRMQLDPPLLGQTPGRAEHAHDNESVKVHALCGRRCTWRRRRRWLDVELVVPQSLVVRKRCGADGWPRWTRRPSRAYSLIATFLLTGGRESEVLGLEIDD